MARLLTAGAETLNAIGDDKSMEGGVTTTGTVTVDTATVNTGSKSFKCDAGAGNAVAYVAKTFAGATGTTYYARMWINVAARPSSNSNIITFLNGSGTAQFEVDMNTLGRIVFGGGGGSGGVDTSDKADGSWHCIELSQVISAAGTDDGELRVDGVSSVLTGQTVDTVAPASVRFGWGAVPGANKIINIDDIALNDSTGANETSFAGQGRQVLLVPTADNAVGTGWTLGTGTATGGNAFAAVDNIPPLGVADLAVGSDPKQIRNASSNANTAYDATMTAYVAAGIPTGSTINLLDPMVWTAAPVVTSAKAGTVGVVSNPAITAIALGAGGTAGAFWSGVAGGTYPTGWKLSHGTLTYAPTVTISGPAPVMRINQVTASTRIAVVCFMGIYVDFTPVAQVPRKPAVEPVPFMPLGRSM